MSTGRRLLAYFRPHRGRVALSAVLVALHSAVPGLLVVLIQKVLDDVLIRQDARTLALLPVALIGLYALNGALTVGRGLLTRSIAWDVVTRLRAELFAHYLALDVGTHQRLPSGDRLARLTNDVNSVQYGVSGIVTAIQKPLTLLVLLGAALWMNARLTLVAVVVLPLVLVPIRRLGERLRRTSRESLDNLATLAAGAAETLNGIRVVQAFGGESSRMAAFSAENERQRRLQLAAFTAQLLPGPVVEFIAALGIAAVVWLGGAQVFRGEVEPGQLVAFMVALGLLNDPLKGIAQIHSLTQRALASAEAVFAVLDQPPAIADSGDLTLETRAAALAFEEVGFDYGDGPVLRGLDLEIASGRFVALVGASGAGKSTAAALVPRFFDPTAGRLTIDGIDIRRYTLASLRAHIAVVTQETFLFNDTVRANIAFGRPDRPATDAEIEAAARTANAHGFISALPHGYATRIDELGLRLSGGERQRICIARAVLRDAPILVLDEATSALDAESEAAVQQALDRLAAHRTVLCIAHRLSTIRDADEIVVLQDGAVVERGTFAALLAADGVFRRLAGVAEAGSATGRDRRLPCV